MNTQAIEKKFIGQIPLAAIKESKLNPRRNFADLDDLAASIKTQGVISPILVRKLQGDEYELVYGARRIRAAEKAGLREIPAMLAECSEEEAQELRIIENAQRSDVHPLHEADAIQKLLNKGKGVTIDVVAGRLGRTPAYLRRRLELLGLPKPAQEAFLEGKMVLGVAQVLAGLPQASAREQAWKTLEEHEGALTDVEVARDEIRISVLPELAEAPFKLDQAELVKGVVACTVCPNRTTAQADLFGGDKGAGNCLEPKCYQSKVAAAYDAAAAAMKASGKGTILSAKENKGLFPWGPRSSMSHDWVRANDTVYPSSRTAAAIMKDKPERVFLGKADDGSPLLIYKRKEVEGRVRGKAAQAEKEAKTPQAKAAETRAKRERELDEFTGTYLIESVRKAAAALTEFGLIELMGLRSLVGDTDALESDPYENSDTAKVFQRRGLAGVKDFKILKADARAEVLREILLEEQVNRFDRYSLEDDKPLLEILGINPDQLERDAKKAFELEEKKKLEAKPADPAPLRHLIQKPRKLRGKKGKKR